MAEAPETMRIKVKLTAPPDSTFADGVFADQTGHSFTFGGQPDGAVLRGAQVSPDGRSVELELEVAAALLPQPLHRHGDFSIGFVRPDRFDGVFPGPSDAG